MKATAKTIVIGLLLILISCTFRMAQAQSNIHGIITAGTNNQPLPNASVLLLKAKDSSLVKGMVTGLTGEYRFENIAPGKYLIGSSYTGLKQAYSPIITIAQLDFDAGTLNLKDLALELQSVTVTAKKPLFEQRIDRMIVNVKNSILSTGSTALDILERSPGVVVNRQNNNISLKGKEGVVIMINGKINRLPVDAVVQMLAGMSAGNIERIELITTPPANYDAEGNAGFINIILIENTDYGTNGSFSLTAGYGKGERSLASFNLNHRKGKFNLYADYSFSRFHQWVNGQLSRSIDYGGKITDTYFESPRVPIQIHQDARIGLDFQATSRTLIGGLITIYDNNLHFHANEVERIYVNHKLDTIIYIDDINTEDWKHAGGNINVQHTFKGTNKLVIDLDYLHYFNNNPHDYNFSYFNGNNVLLVNVESRSRKTTPIHISVGTMDYYNAISNKVNLDAGLKTTISSFTNDISYSKLQNSIWKIDPELSGVYRLNEFIYAVYGNLNIRVDNKTNIKTGLRFEQTRTNLYSEQQKDIVNRSYGQFFPSVFLSHTLDSARSINFSYSRRITRPTFNQLAPFRFFFDLNSYTEGNPALQPAFSNTITTDYIYKRFIFSLSYGHVTNSIVVFSAKVDPIINKEVFTGENLSSLNSASATISGSITINPWWSMQNNLITVWQQAKTTYSAEPVEFQNYYYRITTSQNFKLPKDYAFELTGFFQSPSLRGRSKQLAFGALNFGAQKKLVGNKGSLRFTVTDIFHTLTTRFDDYIPDKNLNGKVRLDFVQTTFSLTYTRSFGNDKLKAKRNPIGAEEERKRVE
jgi:hypothetical protein